MGTFLDLSAVGYFNAIIIFLIIFVIVYMLFLKIKIFGDANANSFAALVAVCIAFLSVSVPTLTKTLADFFPWVSVIVVLLFFIIFVFRPIGVKEDNILSIFTGNKYYFINFILVTVVLLIFFVALGSSLGPELLEKGSEKDPTDKTNWEDANYEDNLVLTLFHPATLGLVLLMVLGAVSIFLLTNY
jgi:hypothetical protein